MTNPESRSVRLEASALADTWDAVENDEHQITEAEIRELSAYGFDSDSETLVGIGISGSPYRVSHHFASDDRTLVGIGPFERAERASRARKAAEASDMARKVASEAAPAPEAAAAPESAPMPPSEPPGPFVASDDEAAPPRLPLQKGGPWAVALPALLVAAGVFAVVRGIVPHANAPSLALAVFDAPQASAGLAVNVHGARPHVLVDGHDRGTAPLRLVGLEPGAHLVSIVDPAYAPYSQSVMLHADQVSTIEPPLTFVRGAIRLSGGDEADGAEVEIIGANESREVQRLPATIEVAPGEYRIRAVREGFAPFETTAVLSAASPRVELHVALTPSSVAPVAAPSPEKPAELALTPSPKRQEGASAAGLGSLDITSSPPSSVVLDGRPLGKGSRVVPIAPGLHTVVFVHPEHGRMLLNVNVSPGQTTSASADF